jgi:hypothetical protein
LAAILITFGALHQQGKKDAELSMRAVKHLTTSDSLPSTL